MTELAVSEPARTRRLVLTIAAGVLLNLGLFVVLAIFSPIAAGICLGYILADTKPAIVGSLSSGLIAFSTLFTYTESVTGWTSDPLVLIVAVVIMSLLCLVGGLVGSIIANRMKKP